VRLPFHIRQPQQRAIAWLQLREDFRHGGILFIARARRRGLGDHLFTAFVRAAPPPIDDEIAGHAIQVPPQMFFIAGGHVGPEHPQERLLDDVVGVGCVADHAVDVRAKRACGAGVEGRKRRLIETTHN
jgi:hypothetical protein